MGQATSTYTEDYSTSEQSAGTPTTSPTAPTQSNQAALDAAGLASDPALSECDALDGPNASVVLDAYAMDQALALAEQHLGNIAVVGWLQSKTLTDLVAEQGGAALTRWMDRWWSIGTGIGGDSKFALTLATFGVTTQAHATVMRVAAKQIDYDFILSLTGEFEEGLGFDLKGAFGESIAALWAEAKTGAVGKIHGHASFNLDPVELVAQAAGDWVQAYELVAGGITNMPDLLEKLVEWVPGAWTFDLEIQNGPSASGTLATPYDPTADQDASSTRHAALAQLGATIKADGDGGSFRVKGNFSWLCERLAAAGFVPFVDVPGPVRDALDVEVELGARFSLNDEDPATTGIEIALLDDQTTPEEGAPQIKDRTTFRFDSGNFVENLSELVQALGLGVVAKVYPKAGVELSELRALLNATVEREVTIPLDPQVLEQEIPDVIEGVERLLPDRNFVAARSEAEIRGKLLVGPYEFMRLADARNSEQSGITVPEKSLVPHLPQSLAAALFALRGGGQVREYWLYDFRDTLLSVANDLAFVDARVSAKVRLGAGVEPKGAIGLEMGAGFAEEVDYLVDRPVTPQELARLDAASTPAEWQQ